MIVAFAVGVSLTGPLIVECGPLWLSVGCGCHSLSVECYPLWLSVGCGCHSLSVGCGPLVFLAV